MSTKIKNSHRKGGVDLNANLPYTNQLLYKLLFIYNCIRKRGGRVKLILDSSGKNLVLLRQGVEQNEQTTVSH